MSDRRYTDLPVRFVNHQQAVQRSGLGEVKFVGPFIPTIPGTNRYVDELM